MDLERSLRKEHSKTMTDRIVAWIGSDKDRFALLMELFLHSEYRVTQRAAWPLSYCVRAYPGLITPWFKTVLDNLNKKGHPVAVVRNTMRLLQDVDIPKKYHGRVMSTCFEFIQAHETPIAVKAFSLTVLEHLAASYPEILPELKLIIEEQWEQAPPAIRSRAKKILKAIDRKSIPGSRP